MNASWLNIATNEITARDAWVNVGSGDGEETRGGGGLSGCSCECCDCERDPASVDSKDMTDGSPESRTELLRYSDCLRERTGDATFGVPPDKGTKGLGKGVSVVFIEAVSSSSSTIPSRATTLSNSIISLVDVYGEELEDGSAEGVRRLTMRSTTSSARILAITTLAEVSELSLASF